MLIRENCAYITCGRNSEKIIFTEGKRSMRILLIYSINFTFAAGAGIEPIINQTGKMLTNTKYLSNEVEYSIR